MKKIFSSFKALLLIIALLFLSFIAIAYLFSRGYLLGMYKNHDCKNTNSIFDKYTYKDKEYKTELVRQMQFRQPAKLNFYFNNYYQQGDTKFMVVDITGDGLCAKEAFDVTNVFTDNVIKDFFIGNVSGNKIVKIPDFKYKIDTTGESINFVLVSIGWLKD